MVKGVRWKGRPGGTGGSEGRLVRIAQEVEEEGSSLKWSSN